MKMDRGDSWDLEGKDPKVWFSARQGKGQISHWNKPPVAPSRESLLFQGDMFAPNERGRAQSLYGLGPLMGPVIGNGEFERMPSSPEKATWGLILSLCLCSLPASYLTIANVVITVIGGYVVEKVRSWRWLLWILAIVSLSVLSLGVVAFAPYAYLLVACSTSSKLSHHRCLE